MFLEVCIEDLSKFSTLFCVENVGEPFIQAAEKFSNSFLGIVSPLAVEQAKPFCYPLCVEVLQKAATATVFAIWLPFCIVVPVHCGEEMVATATK